MTAGVVVVSYRTPDLTIQAVRSSLTAGAGQVVVVDNASGDHSLAALGTVDDDRLTILAAAINLGFGTAANRGVAQLTTDTVIFLNSDAQITVPAMSQLVAEVERGRGRSIVGPRLVSIDGSVQRSAGLLPRPADLAVRALGIHSIGRWLSNVSVVGSSIRGTRIAREYASAESATRALDTTMISGACLAVGREAFMELGGFDEQFFMYFEDADLCRRAANMGMPIRYVPDAVVTHIGGGSSTEDYHFGPLHARSMRQYLAKWYGPRGTAFAVLVMWIRAAGMTLAFQGGARRAWRAWWAALRDEDPR